MSEQLIQFTAESMARARKDQRRYPWLMLFGIVVLVLGIAGGVPFLFLLGFALIVTSSVLWGRAGNRIQRLEHEHLEAKAAFERNGTSF